MENMNQNAEQKQVAETPEVTPEQASKTASEKEEQDIAGKNIWEKLLYVQKNCKAPKSQHNSYGNYNYRNAEDIIAALKPLLWKVNATVIIRDEITVVPGVNGDYVKAVVTFIDCKTGEKLETSALAKEGTPKGNMSEAQATGSASSYARKYALNAMFMMDDSKDDDTLNTGNNSSYQQNNGSYGNSYQKNGYQNNGYGNNYGNSGYGNNGYNGGYQNYGN